MELTEFQKISIINYKKVGIEFEFLKDDRIKIVQTSNFNGLILNSKQLHSRARAIFPTQYIYPYGFR